MKNYSKQIKLKLEDTLELSYDNTTQDTLLKTSNTELNLTSDNLETLQTMITKILNEIKSDTNKINTAPETIRRFNYKRIFEDEDTDEVDFLEPPTKYNTLSWGEDEHKYMDKIT